MVKPNYCIGDFISTDKVSAMTQTNHKGVEEELEELIHAVETNYQMFQIDNIGGERYEINKVDLIDQFRQLIQEQRERAAIKAIKSVKLPYYDHNQCLDPYSCIGYQNAESALDNEKQILIDQLKPNSKPKSKGVDGG